MPHLETVSDATLREIIRTDLYFDIVTWHNTDSKLPQFTG